VLVEASQMDIKVYDVVNRRLINGAYRLLGAHELFSLLSESEEKDTNHIKEHLVDREKNRKNQLIHQRHRFANFVDSNWRWLSLPLQYFLEDIFTEKNFYKDGHPMEAFFNKMTRDPKAFDFKKKGVYRVIDAVTEGEMQAFPNDLRTQIEEAVRQHPDLIDLMQARVNLNALLHSEEGRALVVNSPKGIRYLKAPKQNSLYFLGEPYTFVSEDTRYGFRTRLQEDYYQSNHPWNEDFRWALNDEKANELLTQVEVSDEVLALRVKSLNVGIPFSGAEQRGGVNLLRMASMTKLRGSASKLSALFSQPQLFMDSNLGKLPDDRVLTDDEGLFPLNRTWVNYWENQKKTASYKNNFLHVVEHKLVQEAALVEAYRTLSPDKLQNSGDKFTNKITTRAVAGEVLPPLLTQDLMNEVKGLVSSDLSEASRLALHRHILMTGSGHPVSPWLSASRYEQMFQFEESYVSTEPVTFKPRMNDSDKLWWEFLTRVVYNPEFRMVNPDDQTKAADVLDSAAKAYGTTSVDLPEPFTNMQSWLLTPLSNELLPFNIGSLSAVSGNGVFQETRIYMVLPYYYAIKHAGTATMIRGVGPDKDRKLKAWATAFEAEFADDLSKLDMEKYFRINDKVMQYLHQKQINQNIRRLGAHSERYTEDMYVDLSSYSEVVRRKAAEIERALGKVKGSNSMRNGWDYQWYSNLIHAAAIRKTFSREGLDFNIWDALVDSLRSVELAQEAQRVRGEIGSLQTGTSFQSLGAEELSVVSNSKNTNRGMSCSAFL